MADIRNASLARARFLTTLLASFAIVGLVLSIVGVYGLLAQLARNRTREMGIRLALGSPQSRVRWLVVRRGLGVTAAGLCHRRRRGAAGDARHGEAPLPTPPNDPATYRRRRAAARGHERARVVAAGAASEPRRSGERASGRLNAKSPRNRHESGPQAPRHGVAARPGNSADTAWHYCHRLAL